MKEGTNEVERGKFDNERMRFNYASRINNDWQLYEQKYHRHFGRVYPFVSFNSPKQRNTGGELDVFSERFAEVINFSLRLVRAREVFGKQASRRVSVLLGTCRLVNFNGERISFFFTSFWTIKLDDNSIYKQKQTIKFRLIAKD